MQGRDLRSYQNDSITDAFSKLVSGNKAGYRTVLEKKIIYPKCIKCGRGGDNGQKFCPQCGGNMVVPIKDCPKCKKPLADEEKFCTECGTPINQPTQ
jgi:predicted nucleic acid-binding Zn ribbon protein